MFAFFSVIYLAVKLLGNYVLTFWGTVKLFSKAVAPIFFFIPTSNVWRLPSLLKDSFAEYRIFWLTVSFFPFSTLHTHNLLDPLEWADGYSWPSLFNLPFCLLLLISLSYRHLLDCSLPRFPLFLTMTLGVNFFMLYSSPVECHFYTLSLRKELLCQS